MKYKNKYQLDEGDKHFEDIEFGKQGDRDVVSGKKR